MLPRDTQYFWDPRVIVLGSRARPRHQTPEGRHFAGAGFIYPVRRLAPDGLDAWAEVVGRGYEGLVAKDEASTYEGGRTMRWLKVKQKDWTVEEDRWRRTISVTPSRRPKSK